MNEMQDDGHEPATKGELRATRTELGARLTEVCVRLDAHDKRFESIDGNLHRLNVGFARMEGDMTELKGKVDILLVIKDDISRFTANVERMTNYFESCVRKMDSQGAMLMEHETRLTRLEARP